MNFNVFGRSQLLLANGALVRRCVLTFAVGRRLLPRAGSGLQPEPCSLNKRYPVEQSQRPEIHKPPGSSCKLEPAKDSCKA